MDVYGSEKLTRHLVHCVEKIWPSGNNPAHFAENIQLARNLSLIVRFFNGADAIKKYRTLSLVKYRYALSSQKNPDDLHKQYNVLLVSQGYNGTVGVIVEHLYGVDEEARFEGFARKVVDVVDDIVKGVLDPRMRGPVWRPPHWRE